MLMIREKMTLHGCVDGDGSAEISLVAVDAVAAQVDFSLASAFGTSTAPQ